MSDRKKQLDDFTQSVDSFIEKAPKALGAFTDFMDATFNKGVLDLKTKELISIAVACYARCEYCIIHHVSEALKAGATKEEILETSLVTITFGGGPSFAYSAAVLNEALEQFA